MLKGQDIIVLLRLMQEPDRWTVRSIGGSLGFDPAQVHRALKRLALSRLIDLRDQRVNFANTEEFLIHGFRFVFPAIQGGMTRGVPTAWAASPLKELLGGNKDSPPVWADPSGEVRGIEVEPLHVKAPEISRKNPKLGEQLALLDGLRLGDARVRQLASAELQNRLVPSSEVSN